MCTRLVPWMKDQVASVSGGELQCPDCHKKIGEFSWKDPLQCSCGTACKAAVAFFTSRLLMAKDSTQTTPVPSSANHHSKQKHKK